MIARGPSTASLALGCIGFLVTAPAAAADGIAVAADAAAADQQSIIVTGRPEAELESPKQIAPLLDTPQTVTVISDQVIRKQNLLTLRDALATIPGITFGAGEGGGGYGDSINLRGYSANNDLTQDGVRDSAQYSRTDPFNLQQIEVFNGANSVFNGSGSVGGTINLVSKLPQPDNLTIVQGSVGTDDYYRATVDSNWRASDLIAVRVNGMFHRNDVPGRDVEKFKRWGFAPSITLGVDAPTSLTIAYLHQRDDNTPIYGVPFFRNRLNNGPLPGTSRSDYYGYRNLDEQEITVDRLTATFRHAFSDAVSVRNLTRWQRVAQDTVSSAPQGTFCLAGTGRQPVSAGANDAVGSACNANLTNVADANGVFRPSVTVPVAPGFWQPSGPRGLVRNQENQLLFNQTDLRWEAGEKGGLFNTLVVGAAFTWEDYQIESASLPRNASGAPVILPQESIVNPTTIYTGPINYTVTARSKSETRNQAVYLFDNLEIGKFELNGGVRWERNRATFRPLALASYPPGTAVPSAVELAPQRSSEDLFSYRVGVVFKPVKSVSIYGSFANAKTPSSATVRLGCTSGSGSTFVNFCDVAPETARNYEVGVKADILAGLQATAAVFRNERTNFRVPSNDPALPAGLQVLDGQSRVDGVALGLTGTVAEGWTIFANYTYLDSKVEQSVSAKCLANPGTAGCGNSAALPDPQRGDRLVQTPKHSGSLFTTYRLPFGLELGYGFTYQGSFALNQRNLLQRTQFKSDDYLVHRLYVAYPFAPGLTAQLNVQNVTNERYFTAIRNNVNATSGAVTGGWATPGETRSAVFSLVYSF
ncbi:TonB-dependent receptor [Sphingomonas sp. ID1715]|uniref:TonB-dependent receptor n=1 Tax=Sphingomonas sp. ID1715 TaxID=1656898 RepID=UPI0014894570|nr:TonB-dependent receptor [Sphingomonas sp. ID1715]NNM77884.1 TonB-dependent receptor [Sphingomonas sp. ID1715]